MKTVLLPFQFHNLPVRGRLLRLADLDTHVASLRKPNACTHTLAELLAAAALLAHDTKHQLTVGLQIQHPELGVLLFAQCLAGEGRAAGLRAYANPAAQGTPFSSLVTQPGGLFAVTLEQASGEGQRYQSFVGLTEPTAAACLANYFASSVQTPTHLVVLAAHDKAGAVLLQALPNETMDDDDWQRLGLLLNTIQPTELLADTPPEDLLAKVFAEDDVSTFEPEFPQFAHDDPRPRMLAALASLPPAELTELQRQPSVTLTDATSGQSITFSAKEIAHLGKLIKE
ncbi:MAG: Hsp33 family molecular chaperone HslO [Alphaproteobacteria bacterium]|jgi:molecular chaperone Hsp33|nr:Hsp33 family molecular chaperone HslO [Alphaproteobacteria bacterium]